MRRTIARVVATTVLAIFAAGTAFGASSWTRRSFDAQNNGNAGDQGFTADSVKDLKVTRFYKSASYVNATPLVSDGLVVTGDWSGAVLIIDETQGGRRLIDMPTQGLTGPPPTGLGAELGTYRGMQATPIIATVELPGGAMERRLYVGVNSPDKTLYCLNFDKIVADRASLLNNDNSTGTYTCSSPGGVWPYSLAVGGAAGNGTYNGTMLFAHRQLIKVDAEDPGSYHEVLYTPTTGLDCANGQFWAIDAYTGEQLWSFDPVVGGNNEGGTIWTTPSMSRDGSLIFLTTGDCVGQPQMGEKAESLVALDAVDGHVVWFHQRRLIDTADLDIGTGPAVADVADAPGEPGCNVVVSTDKDGCIYGFQQAVDIPEVGELGFNPLQPGQQRVLWRRCFVPGTLNGGFNASNPAIDGRILTQQFSGYPGGHVGADDANAWGVDVCTGHVEWATSNVKNGRIDAAIASHMLFQASSVTTLSDNPAAGGTYGIAREVDIVDMKTGALYATLPITYENKVYQPSLGGGGVAIANGKVYIPTLGGIAVAEVVANSNNAAPVPYGNNIFLGPYPLPVAPGGAGVPAPPIDPNDPYPLMLDPLFELVAELLPVAIPQIPVH